MSLDTDTGVFDRDAKHLLAGYGFQLGGDRDTPLRSIFECIGKQVEDYLFDILRREPYRTSFLGNRYLEIYAALFGQELEPIGDLQDEVLDIALEEPEFLLQGFDFGEEQQFIHQHLHFRGIARQ